MNFKEATDRLIERSTLGDIAEACGVSGNSVQRARMSGSQSRPPPDDWRSVLARLARARGDELHKLALELERTPDRRTNPARES